MSDRKIKFQGRDYILVEATDFEGKVGETDFDGTRELVTPEEYKNMFDIVKLLNDNGFTILACYGCTWCDDCDPDDEQQEGGLGVITDNKKELWSKQIDLYRKGLGNMPIGPDPDIVDYHSKKDYENRIRSGFRSVRSMESLFNNNEQLEKCRITLFNYFLEELRSIAENKKEGWV
jgi:hypothetical protein